MSTTQKEVSKTESPKDAQDEPKTFDKEPESDTTVIDGQVINLRSGARSWLANEEVKSNLSKTLSYLDSQMFIGQMLIALSDPKIAECSPKSQFEAVHLCAAIGLLPTHDQVALIPRYNEVKWRDANNKEHKKKEMQVTVMPQWQGFKSLMERHPDVMQVSARLVFETDKFEFDGTSHQVTRHEYNPFDSDRVAEKDFKNILGGYLIANFVDGRTAYHFVTVDKIKKAKACAQTTTIWNKWPEEMALKSLYRDAYARRMVPVDPVVHDSLSKLVIAEDAALKNDPNRVVVEGRKITSISDKL